MSISKTLLLGRLGSDPELKTMNNGNPVCGFSVATSEKYTDKNGEVKEVTEWHSIVVFGKLAGVCAQYLSKGAMAFIEGKNKTRSWENKNGQKVYTTEIIATKVEFLGEKRNNNYQERKQETSVDPFSSEIPF